MLVTNNLNIINGISQGDILTPLLFCIELRPLSIQLKNTGYEYKTTTKKNRPTVLHESLRFYAKHDDD